MLHPAATTKLNEMNSLIEALRKLGAAGSAKFTGCFICALLLATSGQAANPPDLSRLVVVGDSLMAGFRDGGLVDLYQKEGIAAVIAGQARTPLSQPLMGWPGFPNVLVMGSAGPERAPGTSTGRVDVTQQPMNLAVPRQMVADALRLRPDFPIDSITDLILGLPGLFGGVAKSQVEWAEALAPTTILVWIGNNDSLIAAIDGDPGSMTPEASFAADYATLLDRLAATGATLVVANIPDVAVIPYVQPAQNVAGIMGVPFAMFSAALGVNADDHLNLDAIAEAGAILRGLKPPPLGGNFILTPAEIAAIRERTAKFNAAIATQAAQKGAILVDTDAFLKRLQAEGGRLPGKTLSTALFGGIFSLDGIHPTKEGAALTANEFIRALNTAGANVPMVAWLGVVRSGDRVTVQWTEGATGYQLETSDSLAADSWTSVTTIPGDKTEQQFTASSVKTFFRLRK